MKRTFIYCFLFLFLFSFGCSNIQKGLVSLSEQDLKNAETTRTVAKNLLSTWMLNSGFIKGALGSTITQLPNEAVKAMEELDKLAKKTDLDDYDLGYSLGVRVNILNQLVMNAIKIYAPQILQYIPLTF